MTTQPGLPGLLVPLNNPVVRVRLESFDETLVNQLKVRSGFASSDLMRRALRVTYDEVKRTGSCAFLLPAMPTLAPRKSTGRKSSKSKIEELERAVKVYSRAAATAQARLIELQRCNKAVAA